MCTRLGRLVCVSVFFCVFVFVTVRPRRSAVGERTESGSVEKNPHNICNIVHTLGARQIRRQRHRRRRGGTNRVVPCIIMLHIGEQRIPCHQRV